MDTAARELREQVEGIIGLLDEQKSICQRALAELDKNLTVIERARWRRVFFKRRYNDFKRQQKVVDDLYKFLNPILEETQNLLTRYSPEGKQHILDFISQQILSIHAKLRKNIGYLGAQAVLINCLNIMLLTKQMLT